MRLLLHTQLHVLEEVVDSRERAAGAEGEVRDLLLGRAAERERALGELVESGRRLLLNSSST